jgi:hypothetical protein
LENDQDRCELIDRVKPDAVYLPSADQEAHSLALSRLALRRSGLSQVHCEALLLRLPAAYGMARRPPSVEKIALGRRARFIADPIERLPLPTQSQARTMLGLPEHKKLIMSIGMQDGRKGVDYLMAACARWHPTEPASIVLAGMLSAQIRELLTTQYRHLVDDGRLIVLDRYLSHEEINACCAAGNLIVTPYRPHPHPSAIVLYAASAGKMVLAANNGWFAYMVPKFSLGRLCEALSNWPRC